MKILWNLLCQYYNIYIYIYKRKTNTNGRLKKKKKKIAGVCGLAVWQRQADKVCCCLAGESGGDKKSRCRVCRQGLEGWYLRLEKVCVWVRVREPRRWGGYPPLLHLLLFLHCGGFVFVFMFCERQYNKLF